MTRVPSGVVSLLVFDDDAASVGLTHKEVGLESPEMIDSFDGFSWMADVGSRGLLYGSKLVVLVWTEESSRNPSILTTGPTNCWWIAGSPGSGADAVRSMDWPLAPILL